MKIDNGTISVLKNFAKINPSIVVKEGNVLKTISPTKTIMAKAKVETRFDNTFAIYNLDRFISTLSLLNDPDLNFNDKFVKISDDTTSINYTYADESTIIKAPEKDIKIPSIDVKFTLTNDNLKNVERAAGVLSLPEVVVTGDGENVFIQAADTKNPSGDVYSILIGETDKKFKAIFKYENLKLIPGDYEVSICSKGLSHFSGTNVEYFIAIEQSSTF